MGSQKVEQDWAYTHAEKADIHLDHLKAFQVIKMKEQKWIYGVKNTILFFNTLNYLLVGKLDIFAEFGLWD